MANSFTNTKSTGAAGGFFSTTPCFCLVPEALYREEDQDLWLNFLQENIDKEQHIIADRIEEAHCICLHQIQSRNDTPTLPQKTHWIAWLIRKAYQGSESTELLFCHIQDRLLVVLVINGELQLGNVYDAPTQEDVLYYLLAICQQYELETNKVVLQMVEPEPEFLTYLQHYIHCQSLALQPFSEPNK